MEQVYILVESNTLTRVTSKTDLEQTQSRLCRIKIKSRIMNKLDHKHHKAVQCIINKINKTTSSQEKLLICK